MKISLRGNKSIKALFDSQVVRFDVIAPRVVRLDVFSEIFEVVLSGLMYCMKLIIYASDKSEFAEQTVSV